MNLQCPCKVEFTPAGGDAITLVDVGDWLADLPVWSAEQDVFEADGILAGESYFKPLGDATTTMRLRVVESPATIGAARDLFLAADTAGAVELLKVDGAVTITGPNKTTTFPEAVVATITPGLPFVPGIEVIRDFDLLLGEGTTEAND